jgi:hypothetical protein
MTKRDILKWLEVKREEALKNARQLFGDALEQHKKMLYEKIELKTVAEQIEKHLLAISDIYERWEKKHGDDITISKRYATSTGVFVERALNHDNGIYGYMLGNDISDHTPELNHIDKTYLEMKKGINTNYNSLELTVKNMKNAKLAIEYLKEVGFDTSCMEIKEEECTVLVANIDKRYLFIPAKEVNADAIQRR